MIKMNREEIKYFKTESNLKKNNLYLDKINQFSYRLFKINAENRKKYSLIDIYINYI